MEPKKIATVLDIQREFFRGITNRLSKEAILNIKLSVIS
jgi:hypothetical protein